jgi:hypothetical protein
MMLPAQPLTVAKPRHWAVFTAVLVFTIYTLYSFAIYCSRTLEGDPANHILAGEMFGTPKALVERGIKPLYHGPGETGWDGQFYYYMANDVFARKDTAQHIDAPPYRYQRVGLSMYVATMAVLTKRAWVSPVFFLGCYFALIFAATWCGARLFARYSANPLLILFWAGSVGTQITLFNALPDAAADAFLIIAVSLLLKGRTGWALLPFALSGLSREVYALFPAMIVLFTLIEHVVAARGTGTSLVTRVVRAVTTWHPNHALVLPVLVVVLWQAYVIHHFGIYPSSQAAGILGSPFVAWFRYLVSGIAGHHILVGDSADARREVIALLFFAAVLLTGFYVAVRTALWRQAATPFSAIVRGLAGALVLLALMYACFGKTVIMHYTGYIKALALFLFAVPFLSCFMPLGTAKRKAMLVLLAFAVSYTTWYNFMARLLPRPVDSRYATLSYTSRQDRLECLNRYDAEVKVTAMQLSRVTTLSRIFGRPDELVLDVELTNTTDKPFQSSRNFGGTYMSYQWVDAKGAMIQDGARSALPAPLQPGQSVALKLYSTIPQVRGATIMLSPVQEGCAWFYLANPNVAKALVISVGK